MATDSLGPEAKKSKDRSRLKRILYRAAGPVLLGVVFLVGLAYGNYKFFRVVPQEVCGDVEAANKEVLCAPDDEERFKYGSLSTLR